jgi:hypothetical protein
MQHTTHNMQDAACAAQRAACAVRDTVSEGTQTRREHRADSPRLLRHELCLQISAEEDADDLALPNTQRGAALRAARPMLRGSRGALSGGCDLVERPDLGACTADERREPEVDDRTAVTEDLQAQCCAQ